MARVLLGQSYYLRFDPKLWQAMQPYPPLGTMYAASYLRQQGHEVALFDAMLAESEDEWGAAVRAQRPDFAILYEDNFNYLSKMCLLRMREAAFRMLAMAREAGSRTIVCGSDATDNAERYIDAGAEFVVHGEGELTVAELLESLENRSAKGPADIAGLAFREADGTAVDTGRRPSMRDLDALPFPAWDLVDVDRYRAAWARHGRFSMNMVTTRGCPFHCNWCAKPIWGQRYAVRSAANVAAELAWLKRTYNPDHISFADDILGLNPAWLEEFARLVDEAGVRTPFKCLSRADLLLRPGEIDALKAAGCELVWTGAESGSQRVLDAMQKGTEVEQLRQVAPRLHEAGIKLGFFIQFGYPGESWSDIALTRKLILDCLPDDIGISVSYPLPGTPFYERVRAQLGERQNWFNSADLAMLYRGPYSTRFYRRLHVAIHKEFRLHKAAGTASPAVHLAAAIRSGGRGKSLARLRDSLTLPLDRAQLALMAGWERIRPDRRAMREMPETVPLPVEPLRNGVPRSR